MVWIEHDCSGFTECMFSLRDFIYSQLDLDYLNWVYILVYPAILSLIILPACILLLVYTSVLFLYIYRRRHFVYNALHDERFDFWVRARYFLSFMWDAHGYIWHGYEVVGLENLPSSGAALIIYYHGAIPVDMYYLVARVILHNGRLIHSVVDRFMSRVPGWKILLEAYSGTSGTVASCVKCLSEGHILSIAPGGVREAQFADHNYQILWGQRTGFAKVALESQAPVIPMFTENLRESFRTIIWPQRFWMALYNWLHFPLAPIYGGFPVKLRTHLGAPIYPLANETSEELSLRVKDAVQSLINQNQKLPGNILRALVARIYDKPKMK